MAKTTKDYLESLSDILLRCENPAFLHIGQDVPIVASGIEDLLDLEREEIAAAIDYLCEYNQELLPITFNKDARGIMITSSGVRILPEIIEETVIALSAAREIKETFAPEDGGDNLYYIGELGANFVKGAEITVPADSPEGAIAFFTAHRLLKKMDPKNPEFGTLQDESGFDDIGMRRSHDGRQYSVEDLVLKVAPMLEAEISFKTSDFEEPQF